MGPDQGTGHCAPSPQLVEWGSRARPQRPRGHPGPDSGCREASTPSLLLFGHRPTVQRAQPCAPKYLPSRLRRPQPQTPSLSGVDPKRPLPFLAPRHLQAGPDPAAGTQPRSPPTPPPLPDPASAPFFPRGRGRILPGVPAAPERRPPGSRLLSAPGEGRGDPSVGSGPRSFQGERRGSGGEGCAQEGRAE